MAPADKNFPTIKPSQNSAREASSKKGPWPWHEIAPELSSGRTLTSRSATPTGQPSATSCPKKKLSPASFGNLLMNRLQGWEPSKNGIALFILSDFRKQADYFYIVARAKRNESLTSILEDRRFLRRCQSSAERIVDFHSRRIRGKEPVAMNQRGSQWLVYARRPEILRSDIDLFSWPSCFNFHRRKVKV
ncbi:hypothetical protein CDAR_466021 [Caerostris darwini]|uniref:Uncharacterized protein n=1 Tax=Caerostris darwini TaxID=1538125 RepID=A0AAV4WNA7_9ARAC|nr:hypothetical protein CDAR_466021 [Caerostris darwini]